VADNPFELTEEQFFDRCRLSLRQNMVVARLPSLPEDVAADGTYFLEGWVVARQVEGDGDEAWEAPEDLLALDRATQRPLLFVQVPAPEGSGGPARVRIDMLAGGEQRLLYEGAWPLE
jgi:hypothetical protein